MSRAQTATDGSTESRPTELLIRCSGCTRWRPIAEFGECTTCVRCRTRNRKNQLHYAERRRSGARVSGPVAECFADVGGMVKERTPKPIAAYKPKRVPSRGRTVVAIGDTHFPFHHHGALLWALDVIAEMRPAAVVQMGDLFDLYSFSKYPRSLDVMTPREELRQARAWGEWFWAQVHKLSPRAERYQLSDDNHGARPLKRAREWFAAGAGFVADAVAELHRFPGVKTMADARGDLELDGVVYQHGSLRFGAHAANNRRDTVIGHLHRGGVVHSQDGRAAEMCVGWLGDVAQDAPFSYVAKRRAHGTTLGLGIVDGYGMRFVPFAAE